MGSAQEPLGKRVEFAARVVREVDSKSIIVAEEWANELDVARLIETINEIILGYQIAVGKVLGKSFAGLTQQLLNSVGDLLAASVPEAATEEKLPELIKKALKRAGIARSIDVTEEPPRKKAGLLLRRVRVVIRGSLFSPAYRSLLEMGYKEFPLSPEALLAASVARAYIKKRNPAARINVHARLNDEETIEVMVEEVQPLTMYRDVEVKAVAGL